MSGYNLPYDVPGEVLADILYSEIKGEAVEFAFERVYEQLSLLHIPEKGLYFVAVYRHEETHEIVEIDNPDQNDHTLGDLWDAKKRGINSIYDLGYTFEDWKKEFDDFEFSCECTL